jgi:integrase
MMPAHKSITAAAAEKLAAKSGRVDHFDRSYPGLALRVSDTGRKAWVYFYRIKNGKVVQRRMTLGTYPAMSVAEAHDAWRKAFDLVQAGRDPAVADTKLPPMSVEGVVDEWLRRDQGSNRSAKLVEARFKNYVLPAWHGRLITDIDKRAALDLIEGIHDGGKPILANRIHAHLNRLFRWCVGRDIIEKNPLAQTERPAEETSRDRVLSDAELLKIWEAADTLHPTYRDAFKLLILTGARKQEISELRWNEIVDGTITLEGDRTKTDTAHIIPLSSPARSIMAVVTRSHPTYVFPTMHGGPITNWTRPKLQLDRESGVTDWTIHDIRRTVATGLQRQGVPLVVTETVLGHTSGSRRGIVGVYQRHDYATEKASALEAWGAHVMALIEKTPRGKVLAYGRG